LSKSKSELPIAITPGEPAGIGLDVCLLADPELPKHLHRFYIADPEAVQARANELRLKISVNLLTDFTDYDRNSLNVMPIPLGYRPVPGQLDTRSGPYVIACLEKAVSLWTQDQIRALVTGPIQKSLVNDSGLPFSGHTEWLAQRTATPQVVMMLVSGDLKVALVTTHLPLAQVPKAVTREAVMSTIDITLAALEQQFGIKTPRLAVCGLNPHAGEGGHLGSEEIEVIQPAMAALRAQGKTLIGPLPADTAFTPHILNQCDAVIAMYHDQGLPVLKHHGFGDAVNVTLGLPFIRTSVDHGTALDLAGHGQVDPGSLVAAVTLAHSLQRP